MLDTIILVIAAIFTFCLGFLILSMNAAEAIGPLFITILCWAFTFLALHVAQREVRHPL